MYFNVAQLLKEHSGAARSYEVDEAFAPLEHTHVDHIKGTVNLMRTDRGIWVSAELDSEAVCTCSRCLVEYMQPIHMDIEEEFLPLVDVESGLRVEYSPEELEENFYIDHNHILDLREAVRQYASLSVPMKPVCRQDCAGICLTCGANLNETACQCDRTVRDSRWGALLDLVSTQVHKNGGV